VRAQRETDATGLSRGVFTLPASKGKNKHAWMPRACPVEGSRSQLM